jgi:hypothetical protein
LSVDPEQVGQIQGFRKGLLSETGIHWTFRDTEDFKSRLRVHLTRTLEIWEKRTRNLGTPISTNSLAALTEIHETGADKPIGPKIAIPQHSEPAPAADEDDLGYLDYRERMDEYGQNLIDVLTKMTDAMERVGSQAATRTEELNALAQAGPTVAEAKTISNKAAEDLDEFATSLERDIPGMAVAFSGLMDSASRFMSLSVSATVGHSSNESVDQFEQLETVLRTTKKQQSEFRDTIAGLPRTTTSFNRSRKRAVQALDKLLTELDRALERTTEIRSELARLEGL